MANPDPTSADSDGSASDGSDAARAQRRSAQNRRAALLLHGQRDSRELTAAARAAFNDRFLREVDAHGPLPDAERFRRAECLKRAYFIELSLKAAKKRTRAAQRDGDRSS